MRLLTLWDLMRAFRAPLFLHIARFSGSVEGLLTVRKDWESKSATLLDTTPMAKYVAEIVKDCGAMDFVGPLASAERLLGALQSKKATYRELSEHYNELHGRLLDEMQKRVVLCLDAEQTTLYKNWQSFGPSVADVFSGANGDIEEAARCLALERSTACVFHLMRIMEVGLKALAGELGIPYAPSWESYLKQINDRIALKPKKKGIRWKRDEPFFKEVAGDLLTVKVAWRNPTMHIVRTYRPDEAREVFAAVKSLMQKLAERQDAKEGNRTP